MSGIWNKHITTDDVIKGNIKPMGVITPSYIGQTYIDESEEKIYISIGLTNNDWKNSSGIEYEEYNGDIDINIVPNVLDRLDDVENTVNNLTPTSFLIRNDEWGISSNFSNPVSTTNGINNAIKYAKTSGYSKVIFEQGEYLIQCDDNRPDVTRPKGGIVLLSDIEYDLNGSSFKMVDNFYTTYSIFRIEGMSNITMRNGIIIGDRPRHDYKTINGTHEFGYGIFLHGAQYINLINNRIFDFTGDCICIMCSQKWDNASGSNVRDRNSEHINIIGNDMSHSRRQGISVCSAENINIRHNKIHHIGLTEDGVAGTAPQFGIDLEGYTDIESINMCNIENNEFYNNLRADIYCASRVDQVLIKNNKCVRSENDEYGFAIGDGGGLSSDSATKHCVIDGNYIENGGIKGGAWNLFINNNVVNCKSSGKGIDARYHSIKNGEGGIVTINNNQINRGTILLMHCNQANVSNNTISNNSDIEIESAVFHNQLTAQVLNNGSKSLIVGNTVVGKYKYPVMAYSSNPNNVLISDCIFDTNGLMSTGYLKNCNIRLTRTSDCPETYKAFTLDNCNIYYNGYRILYCWHDDECIITNCSFHNTDDTKKSTIITYGGKNPKFTITNNHFYNCNDTVLINRTKGKCTLIGNYFEKTTTGLKNIIKDPWDGDGTEEKIYKNNVVINFNEVNI